jgi:hypothetical protein
MTEHAKVRRAAKSKRTTSDVDAGVRKRSAKPRPVCVVAQRDFTSVVLEFHKMRSEHWMSAFLCLPHHIQDDLRAVAVEMMAMCHTDLILDLLHETIRCSVHAPSAVDDLANSLDVSDGTMCAIRALAESMPVDRVHVETRATLIDYGADAGTTASCVPRTPAELASTATDCFSLGVHVSFCELPTERIDRYLETVDDLACMEGQTWVVGRCEAARDSISNTH